MKQLPSYLMLCGDYTKLDAFKKNVHPHLGKWSKFDQSIFFEWIENTNYSYKDPY